MRRTSAHPMAAAISVLLVTAGLLSTPAEPALAAPTVRFEESFPNSNLTRLEVIADGEAVGSVHWTRDPDSFGGGDMLSASDDAADGFGIEAQLSTGRIASTRGHITPYTDDVGGNLPENDAYMMRACLVKGSYSKCSSSYIVFS